MTDADKSRMLDVLLKGVPPGTPIYRELEELCLQELEAIEPIFEEILNRELYELAKFVLGDVLTEAGLKAIRSDYRFQRIHEGVQ